MRLERSEKQKECIGKIVRAANAAEEFAKTKAPAPTTELVWRDWCVTIDGEKLVNVTREAQYDWSPEVLRKWGTTGADLLAFAPARR